MKHCFILLWPCLLLPLAFRSEGKLIYLCYSLGIRTFLQMCTSSDFVFSNSMTLYVLYIILQEQAVHVHCLHPMDTPPVALDLSLQGISLPITATIVII